MTTTTPTNTQYTNNTPTLHHSHNDPLFEGHRGSRSHDQSHTIERTHNNSTQQHPTTTSTHIHAPTPRCPITPKRSQSDHTKTHTSNDCTTEHTPHAHSPTPTTTDNASHTLTTTPHPPTNNHDPQHRTTPTTNTHTQHTIQHNTNHQQQHEPTLTSTPSHIFNSEHKPTNPNPTRPKPTHRHRSRPTPRPRSTNHPTPTSPPSPPNKGDTIPQFLLNPPPHSPYRPQPGPPSQYPSCQYSHRSNDESERWFTRLWNHGAILLKGYTRTPTKDINDNPDQPLWTPTPDLQNQSGEEDTHSESTTPHDYDDKFT
mgnify:FL=1